MAAPYFISIYSALFVVIFLSTASAVCNPPCQNGGTCQSNNMCRCTSSWLGMACEIIKQETCTPQPCKNGGSCTAPHVSAKGYNCNCMGTGYSGAICEIPLSSSQCTQDGDCNGGYCDTAGVCTCVGDTYGAACEKQKAVVSFEFLSHNFREGVGMREVSIIRTGDLDVNTDVYVTDTRTGSATAGVDYDYDPIQMMETFGPQQGKRNIDFRILNDNLIEDGETIVLALSVRDTIASRVDVNRATYTGTIDPSDQPTPGSACANFPCFNGGTCSEPTLGQVSCVCTGTGYDGAQCENVELVGCNKGGLAECMNGGVCTEEGVCECTVEYRGTTCEIKKALIKFQEITYSVMEGDTAQVYVHRSENLDVTTDISVNATGIDGTQEGVDYIFSPNPMRYTMAVGEDTKLVEIQTLSDSEDEGLESIQLELTGSGRVQNNANVAIVTITAPSGCVAGSTTNACQNGGMCQADGTCMCTEDWMGATCIAPHACLDTVNVACRNGGTCMRRSGDPGLVCQCTEDYRGKYCEISADGGGNNDGQGGGGGNGFSTPAIIAIAAIVGVVVLVIAIVLIVCYCRRGSAKSGANGASTRNQQDATDNVYFRNQTRGKKRQATVYDKADRKIGSEFPRDKLKLHEHLGSGAFANVVRADAMGIVRRGVRTVVAVKMLKDTATDSDRSDFAKELKVYRLLEPHPNIIVMLGCCVSRDPMYLIIEYAPHGNLQSHLRGIRNAKSDESPYANTGASATEEGQRNFLTPTEIMTFACQVAKGMKYLASKQCIHRDLATRNVLLGDGLICKLSDFGLARDITEQASYEMQSRGRVPVRWMAPESLLENSYTSKSDVWSFAVLMWELVTVGSHPYPGMSSKRVIEELQKGYRLPKPEHCSQEIYDLMRECWQERPENRPSFVDIHSKIENMLEDAQGYLVMTEFKSDAYVYLEPDQNSGSSEIVNAEHNGGADGIV